MHTEVSITLYNKYKDVTGKDQYKKTIIKKDSRSTGATWHGEKVQTISTAETTKGMVNMASTVTIRIPIVNNFDKTYIEPKAWLKLSEIDRNKYFTIQENDIIVKGECAFEFIPVTNPITKLINGFDNVVNIMTYKVNNYGSKTLQHFYIGGK